MIFWLRLWRRMMRCCSRQWHRSSKPTLMFRLRRLLDGRQASLALARSTQDTEVAPLPRTVIGLILKPGFGLPR